MIKSGFICFISEEALEEYIPDIMEDKKLARDTLYLAEVLKNKLATKYDIPEHKIDAECSFNPERDVYTFRFRTFYQNEETWKCSWYRCLDNKVLKNQEYPFKNFEEIFR